MNSLFLPRTPSLGQLQQKCSCRHYEDWQTRNAVEEVTSFLHVSDENFDCYSLPISWERLFGECLITKMSSSLPMLTRSVMKIVIIIIMIMHIIIISADQIFQSLVWTYWSINIIIRIKILPQNHRPWWSLSSGYVPISSTKTPLVWTCWSRAFHRGIVDAHGTIG